MKYVNLVILTLVYNKMLEQFQGVENPVSIPLLSQLIPLVPIFFLVWLLTVKLQVWHTDVDRYRHTKNINMLTITMVATFIFSFMFQSFAFLFISLSLLLIILAGNRTSEDWLRYIYIMEPFIGKMLIPLATGAKFDFSQYRDKYQADFDLMIRNPEFADAPDTLKVSYEELQEAYFTGAVFFEGLYKVNNVQKMSEQQKVENFRFILEVIENYTQRHFAEDTRQVLKTWMRYGYNNTQDLLVK